MLATLLENCGAKVRKSWTRRKEVSQLFYGYSKSFDRVRGMGLKGIVRCGQKVNVFASEIVDKVEIADFCVFNFKTKRVGAALCSLEANRHFVCSIGTGHSEVLTVLLNEEFGIVFAHGVFLKAFIRIEVDPDSVEDGVVFDMHYGKRDRWRRL